MIHLNDEQFAEWLAGEATQETEIHLRNCSLCNSEAIALRDGISRYTCAVRQGADHAQRTRFTRDFAPKRFLMIHRLRWAGTGMVALLLVAQTAWIMTPHHSAGNAQQLTSTHTNPVPARATDEASNGETLQASAKSSLQSHSPAQMSDDELLEAINNDLSRDVPQALAPVSAITTARNQIAASTGVNSGASKTVLEGEQQQ